jgi:hypothetical protein
MALFRAGGLMPKSFVIVIGALIVVVVAAAFFSLSNPGHKSERSSRKVSGAKFAQVRSGWTKGQLQNLFGKPGLTRFQRIGGLPMECWFYGGDPAKHNPYQFCFSNGRLAHKYVVQHLSAI